LRRGDCPAEPDRLTRSGVAQLPPPDATRRRPAGAPSPGAVARYGSPGGRHVRSGARRCDGSAALGLARRPRNPAVPARVSPPRTRRRVQPSACGAFIGTSSLARRSYPNARGGECRGAGRPCQRPSPTGWPVPAGRVRVGRRHAARMSRRSWPRWPDGRC
jgi:hypothetical protein